MKPTLQLKLSQHLTLTPQLQQSIRLLQLSTLELNQEIETFLLENPMLERAEGGDDLSLSQMGSGSESSSTTETPSQQEHEHNEPPAESTNWDSDDDWGNTAGSGNPRSEDDDNDFQDIQAASTSLREHLDQQLSLSPLTDRDRTLCRFIVEALDDDGYLNQPLEDLLELLPADSDVEFDDLMIALHQVQSLDPSGIGARSPQECLALQIKALPVTEAGQLALQIISGHLELLAERNYARIKRELGCSDEALRDAHALICSLDPHPGSRYSQSETRYVLPDVVVRKYKNQWVVALNADAMPRLRINALYASILQQNRGISSALSTQLQEARWLIKNVQQRFETILRVSQAIVDQQRQFFEHGDVAMRPLTLREIAEQLELHESTISRVTTQKYMATPRGVFELKYFFGSHVSTDTGGSASSTAIRALIRQLVDAEDKKKPLSDSKIADLLGQQGIVVARRTIAKYRESLNIPPVSQRKMI